jgi:hypothetical protein
LNVYTLFLFPLESMLPKSIHKLALDRYATPPCY